eukprot:1161419-Pelagomonas_calceolata.AAC.3
MESHVNLCAEEACLEFRTCRSCTEEVCLEFRTCRNCTKEVCLESSKPMYRGSLPSSLTGRLA